MLRQVNSGAAASLAGMMQSNVRSPRRSFGAAPAVASTTSAEMRRPNYRVETNRALTGRACPAAREQFHSRA